MSKTCCDTSFLFSAYRTDVNSPRAAACLKRLRRPLTLTALNEFEFENGLQFSLWRKQIATAQVAFIQATYQGDVLSGLFDFATPNLGSVLREARRLSKLHTAKEGHRAFDILHVAAAVVAGADEFYSFDLNQRKLAKAEGLRLNP